MDKIKILWVSTTIPCDKVHHAGGKTFRYYFDFMKNTQQFDIKLIAMNDGVEEQEANRQLEDIDCRIVYRLHSLKGQIRKIRNIESRYNPWNKYAGLIYRTYVDEILFYAEQYKAEGFFPHIIILEWTSMVLLAKDMKAVFPECKIAASEHDVTFVGYERRKNYYTGISKFIWNFRFQNEKRRELDSLSLCDLVLPHNPDNIQLLCREGIAEKKMEWLIPYYDDMSGIRRSSNGRDILFFGAMNRPENYLSAIWFIDYVMPLIEDIDIKFIILGGSPTDELRSRENHKIHVTGFVDDVIPYFEKAMCLVAPLVLGAGIKVKILEALSSGIPVITNNIGIEGITADKGKGYLHCEEPEEYAEAVRKIYNAQINDRQLELESNQMMQVFDLEKSALRYVDRLCHL